MRVISINTVHSLVVEMLFVLFVVISLAYCLALIGPDSLPVLRGILSHCVMSSHIILLLGHRVPVSILILCCPSPMVITNFVEDCAESVQQPVVILSAMKQI